MKTRPLMTWFLFSCLILLWGFHVLKFENGELKILLMWQANYEIFGMKFDIIPLDAILGFLSICMMFYYIKYQVISIQCCTQYCIKH